MSFERFAAVFAGFDAAVIESRVNTTLAGRQVAGVENRMNARQIDFSSPGELGTKWTLVRVESGSFRSLAHLYRPGPYVLFNFFPGDNIAAAQRCGSHLLLIARGELISSVESTSKKKMLGSSLKHGAPSFTVERSDGQGCLRLTVDAVLGENEAVTNSILACANAGHGQRQSWPTAAGQHKLKFATKPL